MIRQLFVFLVFGLLIFTPQAKASFLIEPYAGFAFGSGDDGSTDISYNGVTLGGRAGYQYLGLMAGVDYSFQTTELELDYSDGSSGKFDYKKNQLGLFVGYELPLLLRAWGTYYLSNKLEQDFSGGGEYTGSGYALGVGFTGLPFLSVNLEYRMFDYDEFTSNTGNEVSADRKLSEILLSVSLPLNF